jgi:alkyl hydroperoxide reductase subunit F
LQDKLNYFMYELIIIGGGPAGVSAGVYAARKRLTTLLITKDWGGQSIVSPDIQNWIGSPSIAGEKLASDLKAHLETYAENIVTIKSGVTVTKLERDTENNTWVITTSDNEHHVAKSVLIASGSSRRRLDVSGANDFEHKGLTYCASCDGPMFSGQDVVVIGGGNAGFETAAQLLAYTKSVTLLNRGPQFKADAITVEKVLAHPKMKAITNSEPTKVYGNGFVSGIDYRDKDGVEYHLPATGIFVEIGMIPNTDFVGELVQRDAYGRIEIDPWTQKTSAENIWAAGDCTNVKYHQNNISAGDGVKALEDIYVTLKTRH